MPKWVRVTEYNNWEGETWYHYFEATDDSVKAALQLAVESPNTDLDDLDEVDLSWETAETLTNLPAGYLQPRWFGVLTQPEELLADVAAFADLYKGELRKYGEECFECGHREEDAPCTSQSS